MKFFNKEQNYAGAHADLSVIKELADDFGRQNDFFPEVRLLDEKDPGEGISDCSLRGRIDLCKELLKRTGYDLRR